ncbi:hypothetical protein GCM10008940_02140 [Microbulbifer agarilyticus]
MGMRIPREMYVHIHQPRHQSGAWQPDRALWHFTIGRHCRDAVAVYGNHWSFDNFAGFHIDHTVGANVGNRQRWSAE